MALGGLVRRLGLSSLAYLVLGAATARAQEPPQEAKPPAREAPDTQTLEARRHFKSGTKLYRDGNYGGALAEFEEAYRLKPGAGSLQNVALSQKGLFRYSEAAGTLEQLLAAHRQSLALHTAFAARGASPTLRPVATNGARVERGHLADLGGR